MSIQFQPLLESVQCIDLLILTVYCTIICIVIWSVQMQNKDLDPSAYNFFLFTRKLKYRHIQLYLSKKYKFKSRTILDVHFDLNFQMDPYTKDDQRSCLIIEIRQKTKLCGGQIFFYLLFNFHLLRHYSFTLGGSMSGLHHTNDVNNGTCQPCPVEEIERLKVGEMPQPKKAPLIPCTVVLYEK